MMPDGPPAGEARRSKKLAVAACALWILCAGYTAQFMFRGWIPHDEGTIGQTAERVLSGQMPHRDFDDTYTGGLSYLHAAAMKVLGVNLRASRMVVFGFFLAFLAAVYAIARRISSQAGALLALPLVTAWSLPNYFVSLPSWYNLFFATFGVLALLLYLDRRRRRWLILAGACGGLSILAKISGVFFVAGGLLFLAYVEQTAVDRAEASGARAGRSWTMLAIAALPVLAVLAVMLAPGGAGPGFAGLFAPVLVICSFLLWQEWTRPTEPLGLRVARLWSLYWPFILGLSLPLAAIGFVYWRQGAVGDLIRGVFILPQRRLSEARWDPPSMATWGLAAPYAALVVAGQRRSVRLAPAAVWALGASLGLALLFGARPVVNFLVSTVARSMTIVAVATGVWLLATLNGSSQAVSPAPARARVYLLITMATFVALVQFPYATPTYFFYAAPMTILAMIAVVSSRPQPFAPVHVCVAAFALLFAVAFMNRSYVGDRDVTLAFAPYRVGGRLDLDRGGIDVPQRDKETYEGVVRLVRAHANGGTIYAGPDCPEIYFLSAVPNPTPVIFDFLTRGREDASWMSGLLARAPIRAAVINTDPRFSPPLQPDVVALLEQRFPSSTRIGRFVVRFE